MPHRIVLLNNNSHRLFRLIMARRVFDPLFLFYFSCNLYLKLRNVIYVCSVLDKSLNIVTIKKVLYIIFKEIEI